MTQKLKSLLLVVFIALIDDFVLSNTNIITVPLTRTPVPFIRGNIVKKYTNPLEYYNN